MNSTNIQIAEDVFTTVQLKTYKKGNIPGFIRMAKAAQISIEEAIRSRLTPEQNDIRIIYTFQNLKTNNTHGKCRRESSKLINVIINAKACVDIKKMAETIGHELVHAEQYMTGKLDIDGAYHRWNGQRVVNRGTTYTAYRNQPWEKEAFDRQAANAEKILSAYHLLSGA